MINFKDYLVGFAFIIMLALFLLQKLRARSQEKKRIMEKKNTKKRRKKRKK